MARARSLLSLLLLSLAACAGPAATVGAPPETAEGGGPPRIDWHDAARGEVVLHGGTIRVSGDETVAALLIRDGRVAAAGELGELERLAPGAPRVDLHGATVVPGLHDAHGHLESLGSALETVDLRGARSYDELIERVAAQAAQQAKGTWVLGRGWDHTLWPGGEFPHHAALSAAVPDHPVMLERVAGHSVLVNARAMELAGIRGPIRIDGGQVRIGPDGLPTGMLVDVATELVASVVPAPTPADRRRRLLRAQDEVLAAGLVAVHDMGIGPETLAAFEELAASGELKLRVFAYLAANGGIPSELLEAHPSEAGRLSVVGAKLVVDGALGSRGAALLEPYADEPDSLGIPVLFVGALTLLIDQAAEAGLQPAIHAIGDAGNRLVLNAYEARLRRDPGFAALRPRIEHAQVVAPADWPRFAALGVIPSVQPTHATTDMRWAEERLGPERMAGAYAWRRIAPDPSALALGSDFPVESCEPRLGLYAARTRQDADGLPPGGFQPDQRLSGAEALSGFTLGAAYAVHREGDLGLLRPGYRADLTVLDVDPVACDPRALLGAHVLLTVIEGEAVFAR